MTAPWSRSTSACALGPVSREIFENNSEIYISATPPRPASGNLTVLNRASLGHEPSITKAVAPDSIAVALQGALAFTTQQAQRQADGTFPTTVGSTSVTVNGLPARDILFLPAGAFPRACRDWAGNRRSCCHKLRRLSKSRQHKHAEGCAWHLHKNRRWLGRRHNFECRYIAIRTLRSTGGSLRLIVFATGVRSRRMCR